MFHEEMKKIPMDRKALCNFGLLMTVVLLLVGGWLWWKSATSWPWVLGAAVLLGVVLPAAPAVAEAVLQRCGSSSP